MCLWKLTRFARCSLGERGGGSAGRGCRMMASVDLLSCPPPFAWCSLRLPLLFLNVRPRRLSVALRLSRCERASRRCHVCYCYTCVLHT
ncbi:hypothetical protein BC567DRAFT_235616 [Phyllosticta citribraziliensis]